LVIGEVRGIALFDNSGHEGRLGLGIQQKSVLDLWLFDPFREIVIPVLDLFVDFAGQFDEAFGAHVNQPLPKLRYSAQVIVVAVCIDEHVRVEQVEH